MSDAAQMRYNVWEIQPRRNAVDEGRPRFYMKAKPT